MTWLGGLLLGAGIGIIVIATAHLVAWLSGRVWPYFAILGEAFAAIIIVLVVAR